MLQLVAHAAVGIFAAHIVVDEDDSGRRGANRRLSFLGACVGRSWLANALDAGRTLFGDIPRLGFCQGHGIQFTGTSDTTARTLLRIF